MVIKKEPKVFHKTCPKCGKEISSISESQFNYNYEQHMLKHERKENENKRI